MQNYQNYFYICHSNQFSYYPKGRIESAKKAKFDAKCRWTEAFGMQIDFFIQKGGENRLWETLATAVVGKVLHPAKKLEI